MSRLDLRGLWTLVRPCALAAVATVGVLHASPAFAQDGDEGDALDEILNEEENASVAEERTAVEEGRVDDGPVGASSSSLELPGEAKKRIIKTLQRKTFLKLGRFEFSPHAGFLTNDPFINRYLVGASFAYHVTEVFAVEFDGSYSPTFGDADYKPVTSQLLNENQVSPDISRMMMYGNLNFQYSPIYGKVAVGGRNIINFDIFGAFGTGIVNTRDDLTALDAENEPSAQATEAQNHPTTSFGGRFRIIFSETFAFRMEGRSMMYIEALDSTTLEMKQPFMILAAASIFFPGME